MQRTETKGVFQYVCMHASGQIASPGGCALLHFGRSGLTLLGRVCRVRVSGARGLHCSCRIGSQTGQICLGRGYSPVPEHCALKGSSILSELILTYIYTDCIYVLWIYIYIYAYVFI